jgi:hypothetical protein
VKLSVETAWITMPDDHHRLGPELNPDFLNIWCTRMYEIDSLMSFSGIFHFTNRYLDRMKPVVDFQRVLSRFAILSNAAEQE